MKAIINPQQLAKELKKAAPAINKNTVLPILSSVMLSFQKNKLTIKATDLETTIHLTMGCESKDTFDVLMEFGDLLDICSKIHEPILIDASGGNILLTSDNSKFKFSKISDQETFPILPEEDFLLDIEADADFFWSLACANVCKSNDDNRLNIFGASIKVKKDSIRISGTDAFVAYRNDLKIKTGKEAEALVCDKFVQLVKNFSDAKVSIGQKFIKVETNEIIITSRLFDAKFVNLDVIIPDDINYNFTINRAALIESLGVTGIAASVSTKTSVIHFNGGSEVKLVSQDIDFGKEGETKVKAVYDVETKQIGVNGSQMLKLLNLFDSEEVEMAFRGENKTIFIRPAGEPNTLSLLQPVGI